MHPQAKAIAALVRSFNERYARTGHPPDDHKELSYRFASRMHQALHLRNYITRADLCLILQEHMMGSHWNHVQDVDSPDPPPSLQRVVSLYRFEELLVKSLELHPALHALIKADMG